MLGLMPQWRTLTDTQRADWATWADSVTFLNSLGETYKISGLNAWARYRMAFDPTDTTYDDDGPGALGFHVDQTPSLDVNGDDLRVTGYPFAPVADEFNFITVWRPSFPTRTLPPGLTFNRVTLATATATPVIIGQDLLAGIASGSTVRCWITHATLSPNRQLNNKVNSYIDATIP